VTSQPGKACDTIWAISRTRKFSVVAPTLKTWPLMASAGASAAQRIASQMSSTWAMGRHGLPSLTIAIFLRIQARALRSLSTMSKRMRGEGPYAVALRRNTTEKRSSAMGSRSRSTMTLQCA
jgi:hypothetical protein